MTFSRRSLALPAQSAALLAACAALLTSPTPAAATLVYDLEATYLNGVPLPAPNTAKTVTVTTGDVVAFELYAQVTVAAPPAGQTPGPAGTVGFQRGAFNLHTTAGGGILASFNGPLNVLPPFNTSGFQAGHLADADGDGDTDLGNTIAGFSANSVSPTATGLVLAGLPIPGGLSFDLGGVSLTVGAVAPGSGTTVFVQTLASGIPGVIGTWMENGATLTAATGSISGGTPVTLLPEPSGVLLLAFGALGCLGGRRRGK